MENSLQKNIDYSLLAKFAKKAKIMTLMLVNKANSSHIGSCLSIADIYTVFFNYIFEIKTKKVDEEDRDISILKPQSSALYYAILALKKFISLEALDDFCKDESIWTPHLNSKVPGLVYSAGSLGHHLPVACGIAFAIKKQSKSNHVYCFLGDGEMQEGSNWEALLFASQQDLSNLTLIIDFNKIQALGKVSDILNLENIESKLQSFGWDTLRIDGHNHKEIIEAFQKPHSDTKPLAIVCDTIKGKGVSFMENNIKYHYSSPNGEELQRAIKEIENETYIH